MHVCRSKSNNQRRKPRNQHNLIASKTRKFFRQRHRSPKSSIIQRTRAQYGCLGCSEGLSLLPSLCSFCCSLSAANFFCCSGVKMSLICEWVV
jgi:hypothetical protein